MTKYRILKVPTEFGWKHIIQRKFLKYFWTSFGVEQAFYPHNQKSAEEKLADIIHRKVQYNNRKNIGKSVLKEV